MCDQLLQKVQISRDEALIREWSKECLACGLYREDGIGKLAFAGQFRIEIMAYLPQVAWSMYHGYTNRDHIRGSVYVRPEHRHQGIGLGIGRRLFEAAYPKEAKTYYESDEWKKKMAKINRPK